MENGSGMSSWVPVVMSTSALASSCPVGCLRYDDMGIVNRRSPTRRRSDACMRVSVTEPYQRRTTTDRPRRTATRISAPTAHQTVEASTPSENAGSMTSSVMRPST